MDGVGIEVVVVGMGDEDEVGLGLVDVFHDGFHVAANGVDFKFHAVEIELQTGVLDGYHGEFFTRGREKDIKSAIRFGIASAYTEQCQ